MIYDLSCSDLNAKATQYTPKESMRFGRALHRLIDCILAAETELGPNLMSKVDIGPEPRSRGNLYQHTTCPSYGHYFNPGFILLRSGGRGEGGPRHDEREETGRPDLTV